MHTAWALITLSLIFLHALSTALHMGLITLIMTTMTVILSTMYLVLRKLFPGPCHGILQKTQWKFDVEIPSVVIVGLNGKTAHTHKGFRMSLGLFVFSSYS